MGFTFFTLIIPLKTIQDALKDASANPDKINPVALDKFGNDELSDTADLLNEMLTEIVKNREALLNNQEDRFREFAASASDWFWEMDTELRFKYFSDRFEQVTGVHPDHLIGKTRYETPIKNVDPGQWEYHLYALENRLPFRDFIHPRRRPDGTEVWLSINGQPSFDTNGEFTGFRGTGSDITQLHKTQEMLVKAKEDAELANRTKSEFLATMSHEIRTPMNGVIGMTDLLIGTKLSDEQRYFAEIIRNSGESLLTIINDILDFSKLEANQLELESIPFNLTELVESVSDLLSSRAYEKRLEIAHFVDPNVSTFFISDPGRIRQVLLNLVGNAIKFTAQGGVKIEVNLLDRSDTQTHIKVSVTDTGIGIPASATERLFRSFSQVDASTSRKFGGTGLGLAISQKIIDGMKGDIGVDSTEGVGSTFWFSLPLQNAPASETNSSQIDLSAIQDRRILIVDDHPVNQQVMNQLFKSWAIDHEILDHGNLVLARLEDNNQPQIDIIILDFQMPDLTGGDVLKLIRQSSFCRNIPVIIASSARESEFNELYPDVVPDAFLLKPLRQSRLYNALVNNLTIRTAETEKDDSLNQEIDASYDVTALSILVAEDNKVNQLVAKGILEKLGHSVEIAENGLVALELTQQKNLSSHYYGYANAGYGWN